MQTHDTQRRTKIEPPARKTTPLPEPMTPEIRQRNARIRQVELKYGDYAIEQHPPSFHVAATSMLIS